MTENNKPISPLRQRMIDDMSLRKLSPKTQTAYVRAVKNFTRFLGPSPDQARAEDLRRFQLHMASNAVFCVPQRDQHVVQIQLVQHQVWMAIHNIRIGGQPSPAYLFRYCFG